MTLDDAQSQFKTSLTNLQPEASSSEIRGCASWNYKKPSGSSKTLIFFYRTTYTTPFKPPQFAKLHPFLIVMSFIS